MYLCVGGINVASFYDLIFDFVIHPTFYYDTIRWVDLSGRPQTVHLLVSPNETEFPNPMLLQRTREEFEDTKGAIRIRISKLTSFGDWFGIQMTCFLCWFFPLFSLWLFYVLCSMLPVSLNCLFLNVPSVFSNACQQLSNNLESPPFVYRLQFRSITLKSKNITIFFLYWPPSISWRMLHCYT